jgi:hypothetical protein
VHQDKQYLHLRRRQCRALIAATHASIGGFQLELAVRWIERPARRRAAQQCPHAATISSIATGLSRRSD